MDQKEKTLMSSILLSAWGPIMTGMAAMMTTSLTQKADFLRRSIEFISMIIAWRVYNYVLKKPMSEKQKEKIEWIAMESVSITMLVTGVVLIIISYVQLKNRLYPEGNIWLGFFIALMGLGVNGFFCKRYHAFFLEKKNAVMLAQKKLYRSKVCLDLVVIIGLFSVYLFSGNVLGILIDSLGLWMISIYLILSGLKTFRVKEF